MEEIDWSCHWPCHHGSLDHRGYPRFHASHDGNQFHHEQHRDTGSCPAAVPPHQTYNAQASATLHGAAVNLTLTVKELLVSIAPEVTYHAWTFNGTVPGPVLRVRQGQLVHFTLINGGTMPHSIDLHAAQTPWNVNYQPIAPGKRFSFTWRATYPGFSCITVERRPPFIT